MGTREYIIRLTWKTNPIGFVFYIIKLTKNPIDSKIKLIE